jgi:chloramphenicol-sensitive protein RarD
MNGLLYALAAFGLWGFMPVFWRVLVEYSSMELFAHRLWWSFLLLLPIVGLKSWTADFKSIRNLGVLSLTSALLMTNWYVFVWAVNAGFIIEASLGYFLNPLLNVLLGVRILNEKLRALQWVAVLFAGIGVTLAFLPLLSLQREDTETLTALFRSLGISLSIASTFALYGFLRKQYGITPMRGLLMEVSIAIIPVSLWAWFTPSTLLFMNAPLWQQGYVILAGPVTVFPLFFFNKAVKLLPYSTLGMLQYLAPTLQLLCGVFLYNEQFSGTKPVTFLFVWSGLILVTFDRLKYLRNQQRQKNDKTMSI